MKNKRLCQGDREGEREGEERERERERGGERYKITECLLTECIKVCTPGLTISGLLDYKVIGEISKEN